MSTPASRAAVEPPREAIREASCVCGHVHATVEQGGSMSVFHRCRANQCDCNDFRAATVDQYRRSQVDLAVANKKIENGIEIITALRSALSAARQNFKQAEESRQTNAALLDRAYQDLEGLRSALSAAQRDSDRLLRFAGKAFRDVRGDSIGCDWDGGDVQDAMEEVGLLERIRVSEACFEENCACAECGFPSECLRPTALGLASIAAAAPAPRDGQ